MHVSNSFSSKGLARRHTTPAFNARARTYAAKLGRFSVPAARRSRQIWLSGTSGSSKTMGIAGSMPVINRYRQDAAALLPKPVGNPMLSFARSALDKCTNPHRT